LGPVDPPPHASRQLSFFLAVENSTDLFSAVFYLPPKINLFQGFHKSPFKVYTSFKLENHTYTHNYTQ
jgi:hypothetical protein